MVKSSRVATEAKTLEKKPALDGVQIPSGGFIIGGRVKRLKICCFAFFQKIYPPLRL